MFDEETDRKILEWDKRNVKQQKLEKEEDEQQAERDRQAYLKRTGRTEMKP